MLELKNGDKYEGGFLDGEKSGSGIYHYKSTGKVFVGEWVGGTPKCGECCIYSGNQARHQGHPLRRAKAQSSGS